MPEKLGITAREKEISLLLLKLQMAKLRARITKHEIAMPANPSEEYLNLREQLDKLYSHVRQQFLKANGLTTLPPTWWDRLVIKIARWALSERA